MTPSLRPGQAWGAEESGPPDLEVAGGDGALAAVVAGAPSGCLIRFTPAGPSDLALAVGLVAGAAATGVALPLDVLRLSGGPLAVNSVVVGVPPDRLRAWHRPAGLTVEIDGVAVEAGAVTSLVLMNGQYLRGFDVSPRGHPGDGVAEAQLYALPAGARRAMRSRLATGAHLPHPAVTVCRAQRLVVRCARPAPLEVDGAPAGIITALDVELVPGIYRLLV